MKRKNTMVKKQHALMNSLDAFRMMNDPEENVFAKKYDASAGTIHTSIYYPKEAKDGFALGENQPPVSFRFQKKTWT